MGIEIKEFNGEGYAPLLSYNGWRVAVANFCERLREENICKVEIIENDDTDKNNTEYCYIKNKENKS